MSDLEKLVEAASRGDPEAAGQLVEATQASTYAAIRMILRDRDEALDALQDTYLRALRRLKTLRDPAAFPGWLRRIAITTALDRSRQRRAWLGDEMLPGIPVLDEEEERWNDLQRIALARALHHLDPGDRRVCERFYHGGWSSQRLAEAEGVTPAAMRKRLQRLRDRLRKEVEMSERDRVREESLPPELPVRIAELIAAPRLTALPENPVGSAWLRIREHFPDAVEVELPEVLRLSEVRRLFSADETELLGLFDELCHPLDDERCLRTELSVPMLMEAREHREAPALVACGKAYRRLRPTPRLREAFHLAELLLPGGPEREPWSFLGEIVDLVAALFPADRYRVDPVAFPLWEPSSSWAVSLTRDGERFELLQCGRYRSESVALLERPDVRFFGASFGLERFAMALYGLDDIRKTDLPIDA